MDGGRDSKECILVLVFAHTYSSKVYYAKCNKYVNSAWLIFPENIISIISIDEMINDQLSLLQLPFPMSVFTIACFRSKTDMMV